MPGRRGIYGSSTQILSVLMVIVGIVLLVRTVAAGGGGVSTGVILGVLFVAAGAARLYLALRGP